MSKIFNFVSAGEIQPGMFVTGYEMLEPKTNPTLFGVPMYNFGEDEQKNELNLNPWFKGIPFEVIDVAGPLIIVKTYSGIINGYKLQPVMIFDSRQIHFMEVDKEYYRNYWINSGIKVEQL